MKISQLVEAIESDPNLKKQFIENCTKEMGTHVTTVKTVWKHNIVWDNYMMETIESPDQWMDRIDEEVLIETILTKAGLKEYNEREAGRYILQNGRGAIIELKRRKKLTDNYDVKLIAKKVKQALREITNK
jgi:hypothetical protein